ncbi:MAG: hypothetical protein H6654_07645 [Ardenticatenaceae bacterium]|nr:hypothetical protein [Ardenticatenaceae bacterium]MCB8973416.1 hypothetical protein [Ardenticatenaceae bacterium]
MKGDYLNCYTLGRSAPSQEQLHYILPCDREKALQLFALHVDAKEILLPRQQPIPVTIPHTRLAVSRLSSYAMATFLWRSGYLSQSTNPFVRLMEKSIYTRQLFRRLERSENALDEVVLELFHSSQGRIPCIDLPDSEAFPPDLLLARLHFSTISPQQTVLRIFIGWTEAASLGELQDLYNLLQQYMALLQQLLETDDPSPLPVENGRPRDSSYEVERPLSEPVAEPMPDWATDVRTQSAETTTFATEDDEVSASSAEAETPLPKLQADQPPPPNWQVQGTNGKDLLHSTNGFRDMESEHNEDEEMCQAETAVPPEDENGETSPPSRQTGPPPSEDELQLYRGLKPPRLYPQTLSNICIVAAERQHQIDTWGKVPKLTTFKAPLLPSRNTRLKVPELFTHWYDVRYRWNVVTWLRHHSGHTAAEISDLLWYLEERLAEKVWVAVTSAGKEEDKTDKNRRHRTQMEKKPREKGQNGSMK